MSEINKPQQFWIHKGTSNFCNELDYDIETEKFVKCRPDGFYDIVSAKDTIQGGIHVIELAPMLKMMETMAEALNSAQHMFNAINYDVKSERGKDKGCDDKCNSYVHSIGCFLANNLNEDKDIESVSQAIVSYKVFKRENGLE